jgi:phosphoribosyl 1,2-cyclic phosphodiesterase
MRRPSGPIFHDGGPREGTSVKIRFWGVRGSIATPSPRHIAFGGNTSCIEVRIGDRVIILDAGTGIRNLGNQLIKEEIKSFDILMSHTHWDHMNGFPFFTPAYNPECEIRIKAGHLIDQGGLERVLQGQMTQPMFPVPLAAMNSRMKIEDFRTGDRLDLGDGIEIRTAMLNHPNGATGYRIEHNGRSLCYITDTEHVPEKPDRSILGLIEGADLVIYDSTYTEEEFPARVGWGHSTWNEGVKLCRMAGAGSMAIFHHDPDHEDDFMDKIEADARSEWDNVFAAREQMEVELA